MQRLEDTRRAAVADRSRHAKRIDELDAQIARTEHRLQYLRRLLPILERQTIDKGGDIWSLREREEIAQLEALLPRLRYERGLHDSARHVADWRQESARVQIEAAEKEAQKSGGETERPARP